MGSRLSVGAIIGVMTLGVLLPGSPLRDARADGSDPLPAAAATAVERLFPAASVIEVGQEREHGVLLYEVLVRDGDKNVEVEVTPDGSIAEVETAVAVADLPQAVLDELRRSAGGAVFREVERHEVHGRPEHGSVVPIDPPVVFYEVEYEVDGEMKEIAAGADGSPLPLEDHDNDAIMDDDED
jgi:hypothetical protein